MERAKIQVTQTAERLTLIRPNGCKRVLVGYYHALNKYFLYLGFNTQEEALKLREYLLAKGYSSPYNYKQDKGVNLPRPAKYVPQKWEIKIHRPTQELVAMFVRKDQENNAKTTA